MKLKNFSEELFLFLFFDNVELLLEKLQIQVIQMSFCFDLQVMKTW